MNDLSQNNLYLTYSRILVVFWCCYTWICHLDLSILYLIASCDGCHAWGGRHLLNLKHLVVLLAGPISYTGIQYTDFVKIFNVSLDLSTIYFAHFSRCWGSYVHSCYSVYSIIECLFSGVKLSIRSFCFISVLYILKFVFALTRFK